MSEPETGTILIVGGYGAFGTIVSRTLDGWFPGRVLAVGRRPRQARLAPGIAATRLDLHEPDGLDELLRQYSIGAVVHCVEPPDTALARTCLRQGIHLVDVGASDQLLRKVEAMADLAIDSGATAILGVGVAPGAAERNASAARSRPATDPRLADSAGPPIEPTNCLTPTRALVIPHTLRGWQSEPDGCGSARKTGACCCAPAARVSGRPSDTT
ncbi:saccharopine dehydrogenase NADP-binding domain-containing protein [Micromonospora chersina]|uniref:saccharopine dehydrogenase NADP-binding domain-containing protein n=1 Tax=Micromonospora chersina TaxID=47854 RepID=UPI00367CCA84